jgi:XRE family aerobic/anaerobic benzoate catabolism transcriptional regulator
MSIRKGTTRVSVLQRLGQAVRARRGELALSRADLAGRAGLSLRFLAQLETGTGNISYLRLRRLADALGIDLPSLIELAEGHAGRAVALLGLRGAGKSTVGRALAERRNVGFMELDERIEAAAGMSIGQVFELQGEGYYRRLERDVLHRILLTLDGGVLATGGGIVTEPDTWTLLRRRTLTVWLKATPGEHWERVIAQGDRRPMTGYPGAMAELERLWETRAPLYARAEITVDTSGLTVEAVVDDLERALAAHAA